MQSPVSGLANFSSVWDLPPCPIMASRPLWFCFRESVKADFWSGYPGCPFRPQPACQLLHQALVRDPGMPSIKRFPPPFRQHARTVVNHQSESRRLVNAQTLCSMQPAGSVPSGEQWQVATCERPEGSRKANPSHTIDKGHDDCRSFPYANRKHIGNLGCSAFFFQCSGGDDASRRGQLASVVILSLRIAGSSPDSFRESRQRESAIPIGCLAD